jgi:hypothetical protein
MSVFIIVIYVMRRIKLDLTYICFKDFLTQAVQIY